MASLIDKLIQADLAYHNGEAIITDAEYDDLRKKASLLFPNHDYFKNVGAPVHGVKYKLPFQMGSLNQIYENEIQDWVKKYNLHRQFISVSSKLDGVSCLLVYINGDLAEAYTRGDGFEGQNITKHVKHVGNIPLSLNNGKYPEYNYSYVAIRAELIMKVSTFKEKYSEEFKNPRNLVAGIMNRKEPDTRILKDIDIIAYEILKMDFSMGDETNADYINSLSKVAMYEWLTHAFLFATPKRMTAVGSYFNDDNLKQTIIDFKAASDYELDGIVLTVDEWFNLDLQSTSQSLNPEHSVKYKVKMEGDSVIAEVVNVEWNKSKNGLLKPRIQIKPVDLNGVTITYATGHNAKFINDNNIGPGTTFVLVRSGDVIPYCQKVIKGTTPQMPDGADWEWTTNDKDENVEIRVKDRNDPEVIFRSVLDFFVSLEVDQLREASLKTIYDEFKLWGKEYTDTIAILFDLLPHEWESALGVNGEKIHTSLHRRLQNLSMPVLCGSLNYFGVGFGIRKAKTLLEQASLEELETMKVDLIAELNGFDTKTATNIHKGLPLVREFLNRFDEYLLFKVEEKVSSQLSNVVVVMTGFRDKDLHAKIESLGGKVASGVSGKTTHLLQKDPTSTSTKTQKALEVGAKIMSPEQFKDEYNI